jgi:ribulose-phosphate 3-epimerase
MNTHSAIAKIRQRGAAVLPSLLLCDFRNLEREIGKLEAAGVAALHLDVMDGVFVPNFTYGLPIVSAIRQVTRLPIDVHLMIADPGKYARAFVEAGADIVTFHVEAVKDARSILGEIHAAGAAAGIALNPGTSVSAVADVVPDCDIAVVMSVEAGFGGQSFRPEVLSKLTELRRLGGESLLLEIDGGVNARTLEQCVAAGAEALVVGSAIFAQPDYAVAISNLNQLIAAGLKAGLASSGAQEAR